mmetsp:Transcript_4373/g.11149  ORF Transcript_4373/g.11149 Transcript_4373/m.11149 type:complete len:238 (+) Transcript_4373:341-1054(+)
MSEPRPALETMAAAPPEQAATEVEVPASAASDHAAAAAPCESLAAQLLQLCAQNNPREARFLWRRATPGDDQEAEAAMEVAKALLARDFSFFFRKLRETSWAPETQSLAASLDDSVCAENLDVLAKLYAPNVPVQRAAYFLGLPAAEATKYCLEQGWTKPGQMETDSAELLAPPPQLKQRHAEGPASGVSALPPAQLDTICAQIMQLERSISHDVTQYLSADDPESGSSQLATEAMS